MADEGGGKPLLKYLALNADDNELCEGMRRACDKALIQVSGSKFPPIVKDMFEAKVKALHDLFVAALITEARSREEKRRGAKG